MKKKTIIIIISVAFCGGILFSGLAFVAFSRSQPLLNKIVSKLKEKRIAMIPRAKEILMLSDFENEADFARWDTADATIEQSPEHASHGANAARITFLPSGGAAAIKIEKYFEKEPSLGNWGGHEVLCMDIYNPNPKTERMLLKLRDAKEYKTTIDIFLEPQKMNKVEIDIAGLWGKINPTRISQLNLFLWDNKSAKTFYIDNVRLLPAAALEKNTVNILNAEFYPQAGEQAYATGDYFSFDQTRWGKVDPQTGDSFIEIPLVLINDTSVPTATQMFTGGVPFPKGELTDDAKVGLYDRQGSRLSIQTKVAAWWPDKSIKWLLVSVPTSLGADEKKPLYLRYGKAIASESKRNVSMVSESAGVVIINTGSLKALISKKQAFLFDAVWIDANHDKAFSEDEEIAKNIDLVLGHNHKVFKSSLDRSAQITVEEDGPEQACVKLEGWFVNERKQKFCKFIARVFAYRNASYLKVQHTFVYTGYPENKYHYLYKGKWLPKNETIDQISVIVPFSLRGAAQLTFAADEKILQSTVSDSITFSQSAYNEYSLTKNNQVIGTGRKLAGWFDLGNEAQGIAVGVKNLWEQFPKGFSFDKEKTLLQIDLWPRAAGAIDLKTIASAIGPDDVARGSAFGLAKTHELYFYFHRKDYALAKVKDTMVGLLSDTLLMADPQWIAATKVLGMVSAFDARAGSGEQFLSKLFDWAERQKKNFHWYGMLDFGDTLTWYRKEGFDKSYDEWGWHPEGRHGWFNCEAIGTHGGALMQFLRTGNAKYFLYGAQLARHIMDVDTCHYNTIANDRRLKGKIPDDYSRAGSMHRHSANHWSGRNEEASHTNAYGLALYYYLTGDMRCREVLDEIGSFFLSERTTYFMHPDIAPQRTLANILWGDLVLYELTMDQRYKAAADKWANVLYKGQKYNGAWAENYNPLTRRWEGKPHLGFIEGYTIPALITYHQMTQNKAIAQAIVKATDFSIQASDYSAYFDASAYSYWLTGQQRYRDNVQKRLDYTIKHQNHSGDPLWDGMIYQKPNYARVMEYLSKMPFAFAVLKNE